MTRLGIGSRQIAACLVLMAVNASIATGYGVIAVPIGREFHPTRMVLMLAMTVMALVSGLLSPLFGGWMDRFPLRRLMFAGTGLLGAGFVAVSFATSFWQVLLAYALLVAPANVLTGPVVSSVLLSRWYARRRGAALGLAVTGVAVGGLVFPPLIQFLLDGFTWREAMRLLALIVWGVTFPAVALVVNRPADVGLHPDGAAVAPELPTARMPAPAAPMRAVLADPSFWCVALVLSLMLSGMKGLVTNLVPLATDRGIDPNRAALLISIYSALGFVSKLSFAGISDRVGHRTLIAIGLCGFAAGMACLTQAAAGFAVIATGAGLVGLFGGMMVPMQGLLAARIWGPEIVGRVAGTMSFVMFWALLTTPPLFGAVFDATGSYDAVFAGFALLALLALFAVGYIRRGPVDVGKTGLTPVPSH